MSSDRAVTAPHDESLGSAPRARSAPRLAAAIAGLAGGALGLGVSELLAGLVAGAPSLAIAIGDAVIAFQPPGAKDLVVALFGTNDKAALNVAVLLVALLAAGAIGIAGRKDRRRATAGFVAFAILGLAAALRDPQAEPILALLTASVAGIAAAVTYGRLIGLATAPRPGDAAAAEMPDWSRRRFLGSTAAIAVGAVAAGTLGRTSLEAGRPATGGGTATTGALPPVAVPTLPPRADLAIEGVTPIVVPNDRFYRIDTALIIPRPNVDTWRLRITGMVDRPYEMTYADLLAEPLQAEYVTIACVSNKVGGDLVGNALWTGVRLNDLLDRAGVQAGATQLVGRSVDGFTAGFPTAWLRKEGREALVAVGMNGEPLPAAHGFPARLIVPGLYGYVSATKWLAEIELTTLEAFDGYWIPLGWAKEAPILTQSRIDVPRRGRAVTAGPGVPVAGVAWAPDRGISRVEVQVDDAAWQEAELSTPISDATWVQWLYRWDASPGRHTLRVRATDGEGQLQAAEETPPAPDGARGYHTVEVSVA